jgi:hypothetical protein
MPKYLVSLSENVTHTIDIVVDAKNETDAIDKAIESSIDLGPWEEGDSAGIEVERVKECPEIA